MARLDTTCCPGDWDKMAESVDEWLARTDAMLKKLDPVISFPVADGSALYFVKSRNPLVLQHIPYLDAYQIPLAHIRGLTDADVDAQITVAKKWAALAAKKSDSSVSLAPVGVPSPDAEPKPALIEEDDEIGEDITMRVYDFKKAPNGLLVTRSPHWYEQNCVKPKVPAEIGIIVKLEFYEDRRKKVIGWPEVHWEGQTFAKTTHPVNVIPYRKKARATIPIVVMVE